MHALKQFADGDRQFTFLRRDTQIKGMVDIMIEWRTCHPPNIPGYSQNAMSAMQATQLQTSGAGDQPVQRKRRVMNAKRQKGHRIILVIPRSGTATANLRQNQDA